MIWHCSIKTKSWSRIGILKMKTWYTLEAWAGKICHAGPMHHQLRMIALYCASLLFWHSILCFYHTRPIWLLHKACKMHCRLENWGGSSIIKTGLTARYEEWSRSCSLPAITENPKQKRHDSSTGVWNPKWACNVSMRSGLHKRPWNFNNPQFFCRKWIECELKIRLGQWYKV